ncbi:LAFA_0F03158g1_1 [Lachancea sp. 'fantastica']|nr:LAFA_0F03158g1_1 [Lachancea sp. 'fantastica']
MSDSEELLMSSRARRSNAGNKMQKLIDQEREEMREKTANLDDDEINLLFQEDEDDEEFKADVKRSKDEDERLSESESESDGEEDEEAGERELEQQERKKRKQARKFSAPVVRKRVKIDEDVPKPQYDQPKADSLLQDNRRTSKRSSVVANKLQIYEKLALAEKKREKIQNRLRQTKAKMAHVELTQEDRLLQAEETELINTQSLTKFREEEIFKKETRIAMNLRKKAKFHVGEMMLRVNSAAAMVTPIMEIEDRQFWEQQLGKRHKKKKKYTRRKKQKDDETDKKSPENGNADDAQVVQNVIDEPQELPSAATPENESEPVKNELTSIAQETPSISSPNLEESSQLPSDGAEIKQEDAKEEVEASPPTETQKDLETNNLVEGTQEESALSRKAEGTNLEQEASKPGIGREQVSPSQPVDTNNTEGEPQSKQVSFAEVADYNTFDQTQPTNTPKSSEQLTDAESSRQNSEELFDDAGEETEASEVYEGPEQLVGRNYVTIYSYPEDNPKVHDIRSFLFGSQWAQPINSRSDNVETVAKIYNEQNEDEWMDVSSSLIPDTSIFESFPAFGEYDKKLSTEVAEETDTKFKLEIKTPAPAGVILPNGVRKKCLITNRDCQYFDPKNGVPYADVEAYKIVQELQDPIGEGNSEEQPAPQFKWYGFARGGIFLDVKQPAAKGVPEGFKA